MTLTQDEWSALKWNEAYGMYMDCLKRVEQLSKIVTRLEDRINKLEESHV